MDQRKSLAVALALALAAAIGSWLWVGRDPPAPIRGDEAAEPARPDERGPSRATLPPAPVIEADARAGRSVATAATGGAPSRAPADVDGFPVLDVVLVDGEGQRVPGSEIDRVYALPAGTPGLDDQDGGPAAPPDETGKARLVLPSAGRYDLGVRGSLYATILATDVEVPRAEPLRLPLPRIVSLDFEVDPTASAPGGQLEVTLTDARAREVRAVPGRGQAPHRKVSVSLDPGAYASRVMVPEGIEFRLACDGALGPPCRLDPSSVKAPRLVRILAGPRYPILVRYRTAPANRTFEGHTQIRVELDAGPGSKVPAPAATTLLWAGQPLSAVSLPETRAWVPEPNGIVRWSGPGVLPGSAAYRDLAIAGAKDNELLCVVEIRDPPQVVSATRSPRQVTVVPSAEGWAGLEVEVHSERGHVDAVAWSEGERPEPLDVDPDTEWVLAAGPGDQVAGPVRLGGGGADLRLIRGGHLVAVPERMPPPALGTCSIEREDGAPFVFRGPDEVGSGRRATLCPGLVLGPFEPGPVSFRVRLGGADFGIVRGEVRASTYEPLAVPALRPPGAPR